MFLLILALLIKFRDRQGRSGQIEFIKDKQRDRVFDAIALMKFRCTAE